MITFRLARDAERQAGAPVTTVAALDGPELGHFRLAAPVPHPLAWGAPSAPIERLTGLDSDTIWDILTCKRLVVLGGCDLPMGAVVDDAAAFELPDGTRFESGGVAIQALLASDGVGEGRLRVEYVLADLAPTDLMIQALPVPPGSLWAERFPTVRDLYLRVFDTSMRLAHRIHHHAPVMIMRQAIAELNRSVGFLFANGDRGLYTTPANARCASLRDIAEAMVPDLEIGALLGGATCTRVGATAAQRAALFALGLHVSVD